MKVEASLGRLMPFNGGPSANLVCKRSAHSSSAATWCLLYDSRQHRSDLLTPTAPNVIAVSPFGGRGESRCRGHQGEEGALY